MFLGLKELKYNWLRSALLGGIASLLAFMVFMLLGLTRGLSQDSAAWMLTNPAQTFISTTDSAGNFTRSFIAPDAVTAVQKANSGAAPFAQSFVSFGVNTLDSTQLGGVLMGIDPGSFLAPQTTEGAALKAGESGAVVDRTLQKGGVKLGDVLVLKPSGERLKVIGFTQQARLNHQPLVFVTLDKWHDLNPRFGGNVNGLATQEASASALPSGLQAQSRKQALQSLQGYKEEQGSLTMVQVFLIAVSALVMAVFFYVMTLQKTAQFGLLKAIGAGMRTLAGSLVVQVLTLTVLAVALAAVAAFGLAQIIPAGVPFALSWTAVAQSGALLLLISLLGGLVSLRTIAKADPLQALGQS